MTDFYLDTDNVSACELISTFPNGNFILIGKDGISSSPCLISVPGAAPNKPENLRVFDSATQQVAIYGALIAQPKQVCVYPNATYDPEIESVYNTISNELAEIDKTTCKKPYTCPMPKELCSETDNFFYIGMGIGSSLAILVALICHKPIIKEFRQLHF